MNNNSKQIVNYSNNNPYLEDAIPCPDCGKVPSEIITKGPPIFLCGIPVGGDYGTALRCHYCGKQSAVYHQPWEAYLDWNRRFGEIGNGSD